METTKKFAILVLVLILMICKAEIGQASPMGTAFTYQGRLIDANNVADGLYDFRFKLFDGPNTITAEQKGDTIDINDLDVIDGYFTVELDFGSDVFDGNSVWLETTVAHADGGDPCTLSPRRVLAPTPYAIYAQTAGGDNDWMVVGNDMYSIPSGNVGIGATSPGAKLQVNSSSIRGGIFESNYASYATRVIEAKFTATGNHNAKAVYGYCAPATGYGYGGYFEGGYTGVRAEVNPPGGGTATYYGVDSEVGAGAGTNYAIHGLAYGVGTNYGVYGSAGGSPTTNYGVYGTASGPGTNWAGYFDGRGYFSDNVGIGTTNPGAKLQVNGQIKITGASPGVGKVLTSDAGGLASWQTPAPPGDNDWTISNNNMYSAVSGNVGIGTTSPSEKIDIVGNAKVNGDVKVDGDIKVSESVLNSDTPISTEQSTTSTSWVQLTAFDIPDQGTDRLMTLNVRFHAKGQDPGETAEFIVRGFCYGDGSDKDLADHYGSAPLLGASHVRSSTYRDYHLNLGPFAVSDNQKWRFVVFYRTRNSGYPAFIDQLEWQARSIRYEY